MAETGEVDIGGKTLSFQTGLLAKQADGAVTVKYEDTVVLVTSVVADEPREDIEGFVPLLVEYREMTYAAGKIPGSLFRREGKLTEKEILTSRLIDRPLRSLFPKGFRNDVQVVAIVLSADQENDPDILAVNGAAAALALSLIPIRENFAAVRVGRVNGEFVVNPTSAQLEESDLNIVVAGTRERIIMLEGGADEVVEEVVAEAISFGHKELIRIIDVIEELGEKYGPGKGEFDVFKVDSSLKDKIYPFVRDKIIQLNHTGDKEERKQLREEIIQEAVAQFVEELGEDEEPLIKAAVEEIEHDELHRQVLEEGVRPDGRAWSDLRPVSCEVGILPRTHGSALFTRGQTQSLAVTTLGTSQDEQRIGVDDLAEEFSKAFMLHYNFPPFSVGEVRPIRGPGRREIGHGALAERAIKPVMPSRDDFPYTVRVVSEILESNGSSSMATVCGASLSLMDAGVPVKCAVAGVAMGLMARDDKYAILTDIAGAEDHLGYMDFKVAGTGNGVTAIQLDVKNEGLTHEMIMRTFTQAKEARGEILEIMNSVIDKPREKISVYAPKIVVVNIKPEKIRDLIGPSGRTIKSIIEKTGATIDVEETGRVLVASTDEEKAQEAARLIEEVTADVEVGKVYLGKVTRLATFGVFIEILPGHEGLLRFPPPGRGRREEYQIGDEVLVKVSDIDAYGRINLTREGIADRFRVTTHKHKRDRRNYDKRGKGEG